MITCDRSTISSSRQETHYMRWMVTVFYSNTTENYPINTWSKKILIYLFMFCLWISNKKYLKENYNNYWYSTIICRFFVVKCQVHFLRQFVCPLFPSSLSWILFFTISQVIDYQFGPTEWVFNNIFINHLFSPEKEHSMLIKVIYCTYSNI